VQRFRENFRENLRGEKFPKKVGKWPPRGAFNPPRRHEPTPNAAGLVRLRPRDRSTRGCTAARRNGRSEEIARRAGHSSVAFTYVRYGHLFPGADTVAAAKLDAIRTTAASPSRVRHRGG